MKIKMIYVFWLILAFTTVPAFALEQQSTNDIVLKMQHDLNLSEDQVANITQIVERYTEASDDLQKSIEDGTINQSAIDSQKQQIKAAEDQGVAQYLRPDQLNEWNQIQGQGDRGGDSSGGADEYSNLPSSASAQKQ